MPLRKRNGRERELAELAAKVEAARSDLAERQRVERDLADERDRILADLAADLGLGSLTVETYEKRKAELEERVGVAEYARERAEAVEQALAARAAVLAREVAGQRVTAAEQDLARAEDEAVVAEKALARSRAHRDEATDRLAIVQRESLDLAAPFDAAVAGRAGERAAQATELAWWHARNPLSDDRIPPHLRESVAEIRAAKVAEVEAAKARAREAADVVPRDAPGPFEVPTSGRFERVEL